MRFNSSGTVFLPPVRSQPALGAEKVIRKFLRTFPTFLPCFGKGGDLVRPTGLVILCKECYTIPREGLTHRLRGTLSCCEDEEALRIVLSLRPSQVSPPGGQAHHRNAILPAEGKRHTAIVGITPPGEAREEETATETLKICVTGDVFACLA